MTNEAWIERQTKDRKARKRYEEERLILWTTERIAHEMEARDLSKSDLAEILGTSRAHITQVLSGSRNMTLRTLGDLAFACGMRADVRLEPLRAGEFIDAPVHLMKSTRPRVVRMQADQLEAEAVSVGEKDETLAA